MRSKVFCRLVALVFIFSISCKEKEKIGLQVQPEGQIGVLFTDTISLSTDVVLQDDSNITSDASYLLTGAYTDVEFGNVQANGYSQLVQAVENKNVGSLGVDSVVLNLNYVYHYGDTTESQIIKVAPLLVDLNSDIKYKSIDYNVVGTLGQSLEADFAFKATPSKLNQRIPLDKSNSYWNDIMSWISTGKNNTDFKTQFKGIALTPKVDDFNGAILGLDMTSNGNRITIYFRNNSIENSPKDSVVLLMNSSNVRFHTIKSQSNGTISDVVTAKENSGKFIPTIDKKNVYVQSGVGIRTRVKFPFIAKLKELQGNIAINRAEFSLEYNDANPVPPVLVPPAALRLIKLDNNGNVRKFFDGVNYQEIPVGMDNLFGSDIYSVPFNSTDRKYTFDISSYIHAVINGQEDNNGLIITAPPNANKVFVNRAAISPSGVKFKIFYTKLK